jgi:hypothetical protein
VSNFNNKPIDRRRLNMRDRSDFNQGGGYGAQMTAYKRARAFNAQNKMLNNMQQRTTDQRAGTGGFTGGLGIQQERYRQMGYENEQAKANRPQLDNSMYDIYSSD